MKVCTHCKQKGEFGKNTRNKDGLNSWCKKCLALSYRQNQKKRKAYSKQWYNNNKDYAKSYAKQWRRDNPDKNRVLIKKWKVNQYANDEDFRERQKNSTRFSKFLRGKYKTFKHSSYTLAELKKHLESKFYNNPDTSETMTWENYGCGKNKWTIDHCIPVSWSGFNLNNKLHMLVCWSLSNLQPLWWNDNVTKSDKKDLNKLKEIKSMLANPPNELLNYI